MASKENALRKKIRQMIGQQITGSGVYAGATRKRASGKYVKEAPSVARSHRSTGQHKSPWMAFLHEYWLDHPGMSYKEAMIKAGPVYRRQHGLISKGEGGAYAGAKRRRPVTKKRGGVVIGAAKSKKSQYLDLAKKLIKMASIK